MIYALAALLLGVLAWSVWIYTRGAKGTRDSVTLDQLEDFGDALEESEEDLDREATTALGRARDRLAARWGNRGGRV